MKQKGPVPRQRVRHLQYRKKFWIQNDNTNHSEDCDDNEKKRGKIKENETEGEGRGKGKGEVRGGGEEKWSEGKTE